MDSERSTEQDGRVMFRDDGSPLWEYVHDHAVLVACPKCKREASVAQSKDGSCVRRRAICTSCGWNYDSGGMVAWSPDATFSIDGHHLSLWLRTSCMGHTLWAYNREHLTLLREIVSADLRQSARHTPSACGCYNGSLYSRLPTWMLKPSHRDAVLRAIDSLLSK